VTDTTTRKFAPHVDQPGGPGTQYRVRLRFKGMPKPYTEFHADEDVANDARASELRALRAKGEAPEAGAKLVTYGDQAREVLAAKRIAGLTEGGLEWWQRILRPIIDGPHAATYVHLLPARRMRAAYLERAALHPKAANDERIGHEHVLRAAIADGAKVSEQLLQWPRPERNTVERVALTAAERDPFASCAPDAYVRMLMLQARVGNRYGELLQLRRSWIDWTPGAESIRIPAPRHKSGKRLGAKVIPLFPEEVELLREQLYPEAATPSATSHLPSTPADSELVWPMPNGAAWPTTAGRVANAYYDRHVWRPTIKAAASHEALGDLPRRLQEAERDALTSHDLRATAITLMMDRGVSYETCAARVGHADSKLIRSIYDRGSLVARAALEMARIVQAEVATAATDTTTTAATSWEATR